MEVYWKIFNFAVVSGKKLYERAWHVPETTQIYYIIGHVIRIFSSRNVKKVDIGFKIQHVYLWEKINNKPNTKMHW